MLVVALWQCMWGKGWGGAMVLAPLSAGFQSLPLLPTIKLGPSGADSWMGRLVHALGPCGSLQWTLLWGWEFLLLVPQPPRVFSIRGLRLYFPTLGCAVCFGSLQFLLVYLCANVGPQRLPTSLGPPATALMWVLSTPAAHFRPSYWSGWVFLLYLLGCWTSVQFNCSGCSLFLSCSCPSFGCARRHNVSTYSSILAGSMVYDLFNVLLHAVFQYIVEDFSVCVHQSHWPEVFFLCYLFVWVWR